MGWTPRTAEQLSYVANQMRSALGYLEDEQVGALDFLERFKLYYKPPFRFETVPDKDLPFSEAVAYPAGHTVKMRQSTWNRLVEGGQREKFILFEEISHCVLQHDGAMNRTVGNDIFASADRRKRAQESEARGLAARLIAPNTQLHDLNSAEEVAQRFGISKRAAEIRLEEYHSEQRRANGIRRTLSPETLAKVSAFKASVERILSNNTD